MWYEALPSMAAMLACMSVIELSPFVTHYISWGCPMMRCAFSGEPGGLIIRRDQRIAMDNGVNYWAKHMYTYGFSALDNPATSKLTGNTQQYKEAEKKLLASADQN